MARNGVNRNVPDWKKIIGSILFFLLVLSIFYVIIRILLIPKSTLPPEAFEKMRSDYLLMLVQCILGLVIMALPTLIDIKWLANIPSFMYISYYFFIFCATFLGEVLNFYYLIPHFDSYLHAVGGILLTELGYIVVNIFKQRSTGIRLISPLFEAVFVLSFAFSVGVVWEIYEYLFDGLLSLNMQKFALADGTLLIGRQALADTMKDIIIDACSALAGAAAVYFILSKKRH